MATWQLSTLPSRPHHCRATPTDLFARLGKARGIEDDHTVIFAQLFADLPDQFVAQRIVIPVRLANEPLQRHAILAEVVGDRLDVLMLQVRQQALHERASMLALLAADEAVNKRFHELFQSRHHPFENLWRYLAFIQQLLLACFVLRFHPTAPSVKQRLNPSHGSS